MDISTFTVALGEFDSDAIEARSKRGFSGFSIEGCEREDEEFWFPDIFSYLNQRNKLVKYGKESFIPTNTL